MHQAVELILKRMESNPDEFTGDSKDRWMRMIKRYEAFFSDEERKAISEKQNAIMMKEFHNEVMGELLYGEERRQQEREAQMEMAQMKMQSQILGLQAQSAQQAARNSLLGQAIQPGSIYSLAGNSLASGTVTIQGTANIQSDTMTLGGESIDKSLIQKLKELVK
jgi:hypothetical protein